MPSTRKSRPSSGPAAKGAQKTLSFGGSKVSKPSTSLSLKDKSNLSTSSPLAKPGPIKSEEADLEPGHATSEAAVLAHARAERAVLKSEKSEEEIEASEVTEAQIRKYWREREAERKAPRVHQEGLSVEEKVLRLWDMSSQYGPAIGIARTKRWQRAQKLGLNPPMEVLAVLLREEGKENDGKMERAYVDELMSSKFVIGEA